MKSGTSAFGLYSTKLEGEEKGWPKIKPDNWISPGQANLVKGDYLVNILAPECTDQEIGPFMAAVDLKLPAYRTVRPEGLERPPRDGLVPRAAATSRARSRPERIALPRRRLLGLRRTGGRGERRRGLLGETRDRAGRLEARRRRAGEGRRRRGRRRRGDGAVQRIPRGRQARGNPPRRAERGRPLVPLQAGSRRGRSRPRRPGPRPPPSRASRTALARALGNGERLDTFVVKSLRKAVSTSKNGLR
ncbi:MAG: hypothetical protein MZU84_09500 [Sphingobacterium sp.]|nr:hypothetical protein [Sphingobacterium sp.]